MTGTLSHDDAVKSEGGHSSWDGTASEANVFWAARGGSAIWIRYVALYQLAKGLALLRLVSSHKQVIHIR